MLAQLKPKCVLSATVQTATCRSKVDVDYTMLQANSL